MGPKLARQCIATGVHYPVPNHWQKAMGMVGAWSGALPVAERLAGEMLSLPMYPELDDAQIDAVGQAVHAFYSACA